MGDGNPWIARLHTHGYRLEVILALWRPSSSAETWDSTRQFYGAQRIIYTIPKAPLLVRFRDHWQGGIHIYTYTVYSPMSAMECKVGACKVVVCIHESKVGKHSKATTRTSPKQDQWATPGRPEQQTRAMPARNEARVSKSAESQSTPGTKMVNPETCRELRRRPQLFPTGTAPY